MKVIIAGGTGFLGKALTAEYLARKYEVVVFTRQEERASGLLRHVHWDGKSLGPWAEHLEGADILINLAGRSVNCRYNTRNKDEILYSRVNSVSVLGRAISQLSRPLPLWIQSSSATIYRHAEDRPMTERDGETGDGFSVDVCSAWEAAFNELLLPATRKIILRTSIVLGEDGGALPELKSLCKRGLGGRMGKGTQYVSWISLEDFVRVVFWLVERKESVGIYNCTAPAPLENRFFMDALRRSVGAEVSVPLPKWLLELGALLKGTETELLLKSRWVIPDRLLKEGFRFKNPNIRTAIASGA